jgi:uncharacterized protein YndB with AHSA1/START domain
MSPKEDTTRLTMTRTLPAKPEVVFAAWTNVEKVRTWFAPGPLTVDAAHVDARPGGTYRIAMREPGGIVHVYHGTYKELVPNRRLVFTWKYEGGADPEMLVTVELEAKAGATVLVLTHEKLASAESKVRHTEGWMGCLDKLATAVAGGAS